MELIIALTALGFIAFMYFGLMKTRKLALERRKLERMKEVMRIASKREKLTPALLSLNTALDHAEAEDVLKEMIGQNILEYEVSEDGVIEYSLKDPDLLKINGGNADERGAETER